VTTWSFDDITGQRAPAGHQAINHPVTRGRDLMADNWKTYAQAAEAFGMSLEGLRQRARREHWRKMMGNDGKALVLVPEDTRSPADHQADAKPPTARSPGKQPAGEIAMLQARVDELKADLERERGERHLERDRADRMVSELAEMAKELTRVVQDAAGRERDLIEKANASRAWWPFRRAG
jgi:hypothetical protein